MAAKGNRIPDVPFRKVLARRKRLARKAQSQHHKRVHWIDGVLVFTESGFSVPDVPEVLTADQERTPQEIAEARRLGVTVPELRHRKAVEEQRIRQVAAEEERRQRAREAQYSVRAHGHGRTTYGYGSSYGW